MDQIILVTNQEEFNALPSGFENTTEVRIDSAPDQVIQINSQPKNCILVLCGKSWVMLDSSMVNEMRDSARVRAMRDSSIVRTMRDSSMVDEMWGSSVVEEMRDSAVVEEMRCSAWIGTMRDSTRIGTMLDSAVVGQALENSLISKILSNDVTASLFHNAVAIVRDCEPKIKTSGRSQVITTMDTTHSKETFLEVYPPDAEGYVTLYKSVKEDRTDFYTGRIKYEGIVQCPDWDPSPRRECGGGLHLSPTPEMAMRYNDGEILTCRVKIKDFVVYQRDISKVRCKLVEVIDK